MLAGVVVMVVDVKTTQGENGCMADVDSHFVADVIATGQHLF